MSQTSEIFARLMATIEGRAAEMPANSYTTSLLTGGVSKIGGKITEEAAEVVEAAGEEGEAGRQHLTREVADLIFHTMVMMAHRQVRWSDVALELGRREGLSGLEEKQRRKETIDDDK